MIKTAQRAEAADFARAQDSLTSQASDSGLSQTSAALSPALAAYMKKQASRTEVK
eukprot:CAMPEP_0197684756 /NCGR_PEP_ID=MMETSP1338-20131121/99921_1 /TAXON_ID=43686 ORGANISM="Pelagodinium beii, Strain RCC1491" /NCGR_SAMPLE_ID=MMETSP1338 /ASSEMBLY_ACC=CAM_ASM_000754 /LENGTH=54 /DNA_ID=CAMNT_0043266509 /DNA_START=13 /DNA_END=174 /DNA_ORIENTATION=+